MCAVADHSVGLLTELMRDCRNFCVAHFYSVICYL